MNDLAIRVEGLGKKYRLGPARERYVTLRDQIRRWASPRNWGRRAAEAGVSGDFWALKDIRFEVQRGEVVGIIGRNGAGKSTLLKILSRITEPTEGEANIHGRVGSLLEVGTGFHPELTGRENIFLNGAILGMKRAEIQRKFDEIVAFAEVERFIDTPVKHYSSGMYMRLAFAVAAHLEPEILVVDEVLAVGDAEFQKKCLGKMSEVARGGRTVLFVSHNMAAVRNLCTRAMLLHKGLALMEGAVAACLDRYHDLNLDGCGDAYQAVPDPAKCLIVETVATRQEAENRLILDVSLVSQREHKAAHLAIDILDASGTAIMQAIPSLDGYLRSEAKVHNVTIEIELPPLIPREYLVSVWAGSHNSETFDWAQKCAKFEVLHSPTPNRVFPHSADHGYIVPRSRIIS